MTEYKNYKIIKTQDGSETYFSQLYNENCHSIAGAKEETKLHYLEGCLIDQRIHHYKVYSILEVGFGTGLGFIETQNIFLNTDVKLNFVSFEIDLELIDIFSKKYNISFKKNGPFYHYQSKNINLTILHGNARESIKQLISKGDKFKAIYQDAFSPKRNASLWTTEWFKDLIKIADTDCIISTYSSSSSIRKSMVAAGWKLYAGKNFGNKRSSTRGKLDGTTEVEILERLNRSPVSEINDNNYKTFTLEEN